LLIRLVALDLHLRGNYNLIILANSCRYRYVIHICWITWERFKFYRDNWCP